MSFSGFDQHYYDQLRAGDPETERHFIEYFNPLLLAKLRRRLRSEALVEDIRQETLLRTFGAIRKGSVVRQPEALGTFVCRMCDNVMYEHLRSDARAQPMPETFDQTAPATGPSAESELITSERKELVREIIAELRPQDRQLLRAVFLEERDKDEVCSEMGVDRDYLRVLLHRAKNQFRARFLRREVGSVPR